METALTDARRGRGASRGVSVVDDDADALEVAALLPAGRGSTCIAATNTDDAIRLVRATSVRTSVVADIGMPGADGYAFIRAVRHLPAGEERGAGQLTSGLVAGQKPATDHREADAGRRLTNLSPRAALVATVSRLHQLRHRA